MHGHLRHLLAVKPLASVSLGIIPFTARRTVWPLEAFYLHDDFQAVVEMLTAEINVTQPRELADYAKAFTGLAEMAVYGDAARALIRDAIDALQRTPFTGRTRAAGTSISTRSSPVLAARETQARGATR